MHGMTGTVCHNASDDLFSQQGQIANQIQYLVPNKLVLKAKGAVPDTFFRQHNNIPRRRAADEPHILHGLLFTQETKRARCRQLFSVQVTGEIDFKGLLADRRRKINSVTNRVAQCWIGGDELIAFAYFDLTQDAQISSLSPLPLQTSLQHHVDKRFGAAVQDWKLKVVQFHHSVVQTDSDKR